MAVPGDIEIQTFTINGVDFTNPNTGVLNYLYIYEDILRPVFLAEAEILDMNDTLGQMMISGKETVNIGFTVPGLNSVNFSFALMQNKHLNDGTFAKTSSMKYKTYNLRMVSQDLLNNQSTLIAKSFNNQTTDQTLKNVLQKITTVPIMTPDPCQGNQRLIANYEKAYSFLNNIHHRHVSQKYKSSLYTLFAGRQGSQENRTFCTFEYLMSQGSVFNFKQDATIGGRTLSESDGMNNMLWLKVPDSFNTPVVYNSPSNKHVYNILAGKSSNTMIQATNNSGVILGNSITGSNLTNPNASTTPPKRGNFVVADNDVNATNIATAHVNRANYLKDLMQNSAKFEINGNPNIAVGNVVTLNVLKKADAEQDAGENQMNDKVLITRLKHSIKPLGTSPRYTMVVETVKAGYYQSV